MNSEQTWISEKLSPIITEYEVVDAVMIGAVLLTAASFFTPLIHPFVGIGVAWATYFTLKTMGFYEEEGRSPLKNGMYNEIVEHGHLKHCTSCPNKYREKTVYKMFYLAGYEMFRLENFAVSECEECEGEREELKGLEDAEKVKELA